MAQESFSGFKEARSRRLGLLGGLAKTKFAEEQRRARPSEIALQKVREEQLADIEAERDVNIKETKSLNLARETILGLPGVPEEDINIIGTMDKEELLDYFE